MPVASSAIGPAICEALGLDHRRVSALTITLRPSKVVTVTVEILPGIREMELVTKLLAEHELHFDGPAAVGEFFLRKRES